MTEPEIRKAPITLAQRFGNVFVSKAGSEAFTHVAADGRLGLSADGLLEVAVWFRPGTVINLRHNPFANSLK